MGAGARGDVQAMVFANTDKRYVQDIRTIDRTFSKGERVFLLVNPFWRGLESWGVNILQPKAKQLAEEAIFKSGRSGKGFELTYALLRFAARGESCVAVKAYPHDWQLYARLGSPVQSKDGEWFESDCVFLGTSASEPTSQQMTDLINHNDKFKISKMGRAVRDTWGR